MLRNIEKMKNEGEKILFDNVRYDLLMEEAAAIRDIYYKFNEHTDGLDEVIATAYAVGVASGCRYGTKKERKKHLQNATE